MTGGRHLAQARELKSVYIDAPADFLRLVVKECYENRLNLFNQTGLIAINVLGWPEPSKARERQGAGAGAAAGMGSPTAQDLGSARAQGGPRDLATNMQYDPETVLRLQALASAKRQAVLLEDYEQARAAAAAAAVAPPRHDPRCARS